MVGDTVGRPKCNSGMEIEVFGIDIDIDIDDNIEIKSKVGGG